MIRKLLQKCSTGSSLFVKQNTNHNGINIEENKDKIIDDVDFLRANGKQVFGAGNEGKFKGYTYFVYPPKVLNILFRIIK